MAPTAAIVARTLLGLLASRLGGGLGLAHCGVEELTERQGKEKGRCACLTGVESARLVGYRISLVGSGRIGWKRMDGRPSEACRTRTQSNINTCSTDSVAEALWLERKRETCACWICRNIGEPVFSPTKFSSPYTLPSTLVLAPKSGAPPLFESCSSRIR